MEKDERYKTITKLFRKGFIDRFSEIFDILPKTVFARDMKIHHITFCKLLEAPKLFSLDKIYQMEDLLELERGDLLPYVHEEAVEKMDVLKLKKIKPKKKPASESTPKKRIGS